MLVSHKWLSQYVALPGQLDRLVERLTMSGLNHEATVTVGDDRRIDLEVTSNRPDCLAHIGVAREISVLFDQPLTIPDPQPATGGNPVDNEFAVSIECPQLCYRFTARLIRGVRVGPSPDWLVERLATVGIDSINNIVDATNFVMFECGQPLHAFDYDRLAGSRIVVREPLPGESLLAINHANYSLEPGMCVIADGERAISLGGVMGGAGTEVSDATKNILVEAAWFDPMSIRSTARKLNLHSAASFRFERTIDAEQIDWASRRCCELILQTAGGELTSGVIDVGRKRELRQAISFRPQRIEQVLGIAIPEARIKKILGGLGFSVQDGGDPARLSVTPPPWRNDVTREIDLVEEAGRVHGYEHVPDDIDVPLVASVRGHRDRVIERIRAAMTALGMDEAITASIVPEKWSSAFSPWTTAAPLEASQPMLGVLDKASQNVGAVNLLRRSLIPSMLEVLRINESRQNDQINLFEIARVYLADSNKLPVEPMKLGIVCEFEYVRLKGAVESMLQVLAPATILGAHSCDLPLLDITRSAELRVADETLGWLGEVSEFARNAFSIRCAAAIAELDVSLLVKLTDAVTRHADISPFPAITRDFNLVVDDSVRWDDLAATIRRAGGALLESVDYKETFRDEKRDGPNRKRILLTVVLRSGDETLTREQADATCKSILDQCSREHRASLL